MNHITNAKLNIHYLDCKHRFLSMQYSYLPIKNLANWIFRANHQIFNSPIISHAVPCQVCIIFVISLQINALKTTHHVLAMPYKYSSLTSYRLLHKFQALRSFRKPRNVT